MTEPLERVQRNDRIKWIVALEPEILLVLKTAALFTDVQNRWQMYEELKQRFSLLVGWSARHPQLRSSRYYEAMIDAVDALLPRESEMLEEIEA